MKVHGPRIKAARGFAGGISTAELATRLGVSDSTVKRWEKGDPSLTPGYRLAIAEVCDVPPEFLEGGWGTPSREELADRVNTLEWRLSAAFRLLVSQAGAAAVQEALRRAQDEGHAGGGESGPPPG